jgi:hypothetical protein
MSNPGVAPVEAPSSDVDGAVAALENARVLLESGTPDDVRQHITHAIGLLRPSGVGTSGVKAAPAPDAWMHEEDPSRVISAIQKAQALRDGGASASSVKPYCVPLTRGVGGTPE